MNFYSPKIKLSAVFVLVVILLVFSVLAVYFFKKNKPTAESQNSLDQKSENAEEPNIDKQNIDSEWETYINDKYGIQFSYPPSDDFKTIDRQSVDELLQSGAAKNIEEARSMARETFKPGYTDDWLYIHFDAYSLSVGKMSIADIDEVIAKRTELLVSNLKTEISDMIIGQVEAKKILVVPQDKRFPFWETHIMAVKNNFIYDFTYTGILGSKGQPIDDDNFNKGVSMLEKIALTAVFNDKFNSETIKQLIAKQKRDAQLNEANEAESLKDAAIKANDSKLCPEFSGVAREECYKEIGIKNSNVSDCAHAGDLSDDCYSEIAQKKADLAYCDMIIKRGFA